MSGAEGKARLWVRVRARATCQLRLTTSSSEISSLVVVRLEPVEEEFQLRRAARRRFPPPRYLHTYCARTAPAPPLMLNKGTARVVMRRVRGMAHGFQGLKSHRVPAMPQLAHKTCRLSPCSPMLPTLLAPARPVGRMPCP